MPASGHQQKGLNRAFLVRFFTKKADAGRLSAGRTVEGRRPRRTERRLGLVEAIGRASAGAAYSITSVARSRIDGVR
jgi:hypothetical protein